jgi:ATP-dependent helicase HrpA
MVRDSLVAAGALRYPEELPITARHDELVAALAQHRVVIVAGETGSGKSTQLPKLCLEAGRGVAGLIGHTQPRRVAARTIAERVASELGTSVGEAVGYSVRFDDRAGADTLVRVMTDGILLADLQRDRMLHRYDTLIIDEAHERSLNIDFILGYLRRLLPRRPDLSVVVTSATIDTARFASHFSDDSGPATVIEVAGRTYPVEVRYRPVGDDGGDQVQAVIDAVDELERQGPGDVLVFLSGEREIHDTADALRRDRPDVEVLPLYARLSSAEQHRIFQPHPGRRIVLSTNVAETSLTVPGVRYVVDAGTARISRYSRRLKVQRLPIEPVSQASADQRAGRCGRLGPGICIRLYSADDFASRPEFTEPEILRTNLASVILQMTAIGLGDVAAFPFIEAPDSAAVRDGYLLLEELAAIDAADVGPGGAQVLRSGVRPLTPIGRRLARLPVDPRLGRMVLEAERHGCVREVLVIASALSIQDPRERPVDERPQADAAHRRFDVAGSDLLSIVGLWDYLRAEQRQRSSNQFRKLCRAEYLNYLRVREWQDLFSQLRRVAGDLGIRVTAEAGHPDHVHQSVLAGLLSHLGFRDRDPREFRGARGAVFAIAPGSVLAKRPPRWVMAGELVETSRLWARRVATVQPEWAERIGAHLVKRSFSEPRWDRRGGRAVATETVTLYGLPIVTGRTVGYDRVDRAEARDLFIRNALVYGEWDADHRFLRRNREFVEEVGALEARVRRGHLLDDDAVHDFYDRHVPADVVSARHFERWWRDAGAAAPDMLELTVDELRDRHGAAIRLDDYPDNWRFGDPTLDTAQILDVPLTYRFAPGEPLDGVTLRVPLTALNQVTYDGLDWQIPGYRGELVEALVRTLPKDVRRQLIPLADTARAAAARLGQPGHLGTAQTHEPLGTAQTHEPLGTAQTHEPLGTAQTRRGRLVDALAAAITEVSGVPVRGADFDPTAVPAHLRVNVLVIDEHGRARDADTDLEAIRARLASTARQAIADVLPLAERAGITSWDVGTLPSVVEADRDGHRVVGFPALLDHDDSVSLRIVTTRDLQQRVMRGGVRRLLLLTAPPSVGDAARRLDEPARLAIATSGTTLAELAADCRFVAVDKLLDSAALPWDEPAFAALQHDVRVGAGRIAAATLSAAAGVLVAARVVRRRLERLVADSVQPSVADAGAHLRRLVGRHFVINAGADRLDDVRRYVEGIAYRLDRLADDVARDVRRMAEVVPLERRYDDFVRRLGRARPSADVVEVRWMLEELRIIVFAQPLGVGERVSVRRVAERLGAIGA